MNTYCFSEDFLAQRQFGTYQTSRSASGKLLKFPAHKQYNAPPFSYLDANAKQVAFHGTGSNIAVTDLDSCFHNERVKPWAAKFVQKQTLRTAHEISVSGTGAHFFDKIIGEIPPDLQGIHLWDQREGAQGDDTGKVELYVNTKWIALTSKPIYNEPHPVVRELTVEQLREYISELAALRPQHRTAHKVDRYQSVEVSGELPGLDERFDINIFLKWLDIPVWKTEQIKSTTFYRLEYCPFRPQSGHECMPAITLGETLGFTCHHPSCTDVHIGDVVSNKKGVCPCPIWRDDDEAFMERQRQICAKVGIVLAGVGR
jgi:hypothetical protein